MHICIYFLRQQKLYKKNTKTDILKKCLFFNAVLDPTDSNCIDKNMIFLCSTEASHEG